MVTEAHLWSVLGIEPTDDVRAIKRAYAAKLKKCRPEDDAAGFQELNSCYKHAVAMVKHQAWVAQQEQEEAEAEVQAQSEPQEAVARPQDDEPSTSVTEATPKIEQYEETTEAFEAPEQPTAEQIEAQAIADAWNAEGKRLTEMVQALLQDSRQRNRPAAWQFLFESDYILEVDFRWHLAIAVFYEIGEFNLECRKQRKKFRVIPGTVLQHLNNLFNWSVMEYDIRSQVQEKACDLIFPQLERGRHNHDPLQAVRGAEVHRAQPKTEAVLAREAWEQENGNYSWWRDHVVPNSKRMFAWLLDLGMVIGLTAVMLEIAEKFVNIALFNETGGIQASAVVAMLAVMFLYFWLLESSHYQASVGKILLKMKVTDKEGERLNLYGGFIRTALFFLLSVFGKITIIVNAFIGPRYLHDRLTKTNVEYER